MSHAKDIPIGTRFGRLVVVEAATKGGWFLRCDCGNIVVRPGFALRRMQRVGLRPRCGASCPILIRLRQLKAAQSRAAWREALLKQLELCGSLWSDDQEETLLNQIRSDFEAADIGYSRQQRLPEPREPLQLDEAWYPPRFENGYVPKPAFRRGSTKPGETASLVRDNQPTAAAAASEAAAPSVPSCAHRKIYGCLRWQPVQPGLVGRLWICLDCYVIGPETFAADAEPPEQAKLYEALQRLHVMRNAW